MKVTYKWLKDFVEIKIPPAALAEKLTMAGLEVTSLEEKGGDFIFEIEVTSNRPDWLSVIGIAREVAAITNKKLKLPSLEHKKSLQLTAYSLQPFLIAIEDKKDCPLYTAKIIKDVKVGPSPEWLRKRLELIGCRSINNVVDITNYVLFEWGEPLHAFDLDKLNTDKIIVRRAKKDERITTIDGEARALTEEALVIADNQKAVALAGIMGGRETEVTESTRNILLEAAIFNPVLIRRARQKSGIQTDSSYRFERSIGPEIAEQASYRAQELIEKICGGRRVLAKAQGSVKAKKRAVNLDISFASKILGTTLSAPKVKQILNNLGFKVKADKKGRVVNPPSFRQDVNSQIDLIEEIARISGYEDIPKSLPAIRPKLTDANTREKVALIKEILLGLGLNEAITYSLIDRNLLRAFGKDDSGCAEILNPLSKEQELLRPTLIPSLCRVVSCNLNQKQEYVNIFEVARVFLKGASSLPQEALVLAICLSGTRSWLLQEGQIKDTQGLLHLKGITEALFERLGIKGYNFKGKDGDCGIEIFVNNEKMGVMAEVAQRALDNLDIKNKGVCALEVSLDKLLSFLNLEKRYAPLPKYPGILRDISLVIKEDVPAQDILEAIKQNARPLLKEARVIDFYKGKQIPAGFKGLTVSCFYRSDEETLTESRINPVHSVVSGVLKERFGANIR